VSRPPSKRELSGSFHELLQQRGHDDLPSSGLAHDPRGEDDRLPEAIVRLCDHLAGMAPDDVPARLRLLDAGISAPARRAPWPATPARRATPACRRAARARARAAYAAPPRDRSAVARAGRAC